MSLDNIIAETKNILAEVQGVANVYEYIRFIKDDAGFKATFFDQASGRVNAWMVTREVTGSAEMDIHADERHAHGRDPRLSQAEGFRRDGEIFQLLVEAIRATFRANRQLNGKATWHHGLSARAVTHVMFGGVLCHYCELAMQVEEYPLVY
jgi:hypothetical protein